MMVRMSLSLVLVAVFGNTLLAEQETASLKVGDQVVIQMTGQLALEYARRTGWTVERTPPSGLDVQTLATITQQLDNGRIRIEHSSQIKKDGKVSHLLTLTATVDSSRVTTDVIPKGTPFYASPGEHQNGTPPKLSTEETKTLRLHLSELKDLKLRTWTLSDEIGN